VLLLLGVGGRLTAGISQLRKVLSRSESGNCSSSKGENPCRGAETTQPLNNAMIHVDDEVFKGFDETANLLLEQAQMSGSVIQTARR
jgi:hypothetical protein